MIIQKHLNTPYVELNKEKCTLTIKGKSYPEHAGRFYDPIIEELDKCVGSMSNSRVTINLALEISNSVSTKYLFTLVNNIYKTSLGIDVYWYYESGDEDMLEEGEILQDSFPKANFHLIEVEDLNEI